jgi:lipopolysaccharide export system permease protein
VIPRLDRYVARFYLSSWVVSTVFFVGLYGVYDFFQNVDDLLDEFRSDASGLSSVGMLYLYQLPVMLARVAPFMLVAAALVTITRLQRHNEFLAMVMTGRSPHRVARPVILLTAVFVVGMVGVQEFVAPAVSEARDELIASLLETDGEWTIERISMRDAEGRLVTAVDYDVGSRSAGRLNVSWRDDDGDDVLVSGEGARHDPGARGWRIVNGTIAIRDGATGEQTEDEASFVSTDIDPDALMASSRHPFDMSYAQLLDLSERYPGSRRYRLLRHYHVTFPLALVLVTLLALRFSLKPDPSRRLQGLGASLLACLGFQVLDAAMQQLGAEGTLPPVLAAWMPVIVAGSLVAVLAEPEADPRSAQAG